MTLFATGRKTEICKCIQYLMRNDEYVSFCAVAKRKGYDRCALYKLSSRIKRTIEINVLGAQTLPSEERDVTMVTQLDTSRIGRLFEMANLWKCEYTYGI